MIDSCRRLALVALFLMATIGAGACEGEFSMAGYTADQVFPDPSAERLARAAVAGDIEEIDAAIAAGADPNYEGLQEMTPFAWALFAQNKASFERLYQLGGDPFQQDYRTRTVAATVMDDPDYLEILLENDMDPNQPEGHQERTLLYEAISAGRLPQFELLLEYCADLHWIRNEGSGISVGLRSSNSSRYDFLLRLLEEGYAYDLRGMAAAIIRQVISEDAFPEAAARRDHILGILEERGVKFPVDPDVRTPVPTKRSPPLYAKSCQERMNKS